MADLAIIMGAALIGGLIAYRFRLPVLLGYLVAGMLIGPDSFGLVKNVNLIETLASIGVVLLLFTLGMEFSHFLPSELLIQNACEMILKATYYGLCYCLS